MSPRGLYLFSITISVLLILVMGFLFYLGNKLSTQQAPLIYASMKLKLEATTGHLWLEEIMAGDRNESIEEVWAHIDQADWYANAMLHGDSNDMGTYHPLADPRIRANIIAFRQVLADFRGIAIQRYNNFSASIPGTDIDQRFDTVFHEFIQAADHVELMIQQLISNELKQYQWLGAVLVFVSAIISLFLSNFLYRREANREQLLGSLTEANHSIEEKNKELDYLAHFDHLTGLPNRALFTDRLEQAIAHSNRKQSAFALLFIDLDNFKAVNDRYGHQQGDRLLKLISQRIQHCIRDDDSLVRNSGDEFIIILYDINSVDLAISASINISSKVITEIQNPFDLDGPVAHISASIGIAIFPTDSTHAETLTRHADNAMYHAKSLGGNNYQFYSEELNQKAMHKLEVEHDLRDAIKHDQFELHFHPQWELNSGNICGLEALVRWQRPGRGLLFPDEFIPVAESCGLIQELDALIMAKSLKQYKLWKEKGFNFGRIAINVSSISFQQSDFLSLVVQLLTDIGVQGEDIELEITESFLVEDSEQSQSMLSNLNKLGIHVAIDDFGRGYSSMAYLKYFSIQTLKIDRSFVSDYNRNKVSAVILKNMVTLGNDLGLNIIAEGIETKEQEEHLKKLGCNIGQGYYLTRPIPAEALEAFLVTKSSNNIYILNPNRIPQST